MANYFESLFKRNLQLNVYNNAVTEPVTFNQLSFEQLEALYLTLPDARIIEDYIGDNVSKIETGVYDRGGKEVFRSKLNQLTQEVNPSQNWQEFVKECMVAFGLTGNIFIKRNPNTGYLYTLLTSNTNIVLGLDKTIPEYDNFVSGYYQELGGRVINLNTNDVFHMKMANLADQDGLWAYGSSPYFAGTPSIKTLEANYSSRVSTIRDRGALGFITNDSERPNKEQSKVAQDALRSKGITEDKDKWVVTTEKLRWQQMSLGLTELQLIENLNQDFDTLCKLRGLDPLLFKGGDTAFTNQVQVIKKAINNVIIPTTNKFYNKLNEWLSPMYGGLQILPKFDELPEYAQITADLSTKLLAEVEKGVITKEQAYYMLYPNGEYVEQKEIVPTVQPVEQIPQFSVNGNEN